MRSIPAWPTRLAFAAAIAIFSGFSPSTVPVRAGPSTGPQYLPGDRVTTTADAPLRIENNVLRVVPRKTVLDVENVDFPWLWVSVPAGREKVSGWVDQRRVTPDLPDQYVGLRLLCQADFTRAIAAFAKRARLQPTSENFAWRGVAHAASDDWGNALADFRQALAIDPRSGDAQTLQALAELASGDPAAAVATCTKILSRSPTLPPAMACRARALLAQQQYAAAITDCNRLIERETNDKDPWVGGPLSTWLIVRGRDRRLFLLEGSTAILGGEKIDQSIRADALTVRGIARARQQEPDKAMADLTAAIGLKLAPDEAYTVRAELFEKRSKPEKAAEDWLTLGRRLLWKGKAAEAVAATDKALQLLPKSDDARFARCIAWWLHHEADKAAAGLEELAKKDPKLLAFKELRGMTRMSQAKPGLAADDFRAALKTNPSGVDTNQVCLAAALACQGKLTEGIAVLDGIPLGTDKKDPATHAARAMVRVLRATLRMVNDDGAGAQRELAGAIGDRNSGLATPHFVMAFVCHQRKDVREAAAALERGKAIVGESQFPLLQFYVSDLMLAFVNDLLRGSPGLAEAYICRGLLRLEQGDFAMAVDDFSEVIASKTAYRPFAYFFRGLARFSAGDEAGGDADFQRAKETFQTAGGPKRHST